MSYTHDTCATHVHVSMYMYVQGCTTAHSNCGGVAACVCTTHRDRMVCLWGREPTSSCSPLSRSSLQRGKAQALRRPPPTTEHPSEPGSSHNTAFHKGAKQIPDMPNHFTERGSVHHD